MEALQIRNLSETCFDSTSKLPWIPLRKKLRHVLHANRTCEWGRSLQKSMRPPRIFAQPEKNSTPFHGLVKALVNVDFGLVGTAPSDRSWWAPQLLRWPSDCALVERAVSITTSYYDLMSHKKQCLIFRQLT